MSLKVYYLASEIAPFSETYSLAQFSKRLCSIFQERDLDIRLIQPKYGYISERKFNLREVIRLREMPISFDGEEKIGSVKSAFIPNTKVQVYFMEDRQFFKPVTNLLYKARNGRMLKDNPERYAYFARVALENLKHLFWKPDIIICNDWQMSFVPALYELQYADKDFYQDIKTVFLLHSANSNVYFSKDSYDAIDLSGVSDNRLPDSSNGFNNLELALNFTHHVVTVFSPDGCLESDLKNEPDLASLLKSHAKAERLEVLDDTDEAWTKAADQLEKTLRNL
ncbi:MAG: glycogen/starch synthase [Fidelibacterota bacterium]|nr:MAG: glycogen/starch synthase [Candidatus Neomarinimicrobiota bacterium]